MLPAPSASPGRGVTSRVGVRSAVRHRFNDPKGYWLQNHWPRWPRGMLRADKPAYSVPPAGFGPVIVGTFHFSSQPCFSLGQPTGQPSLICTSTLTPTNQERDRWFGWVTMWGLETVDHNRSRSPALYSPARVSGVRNFACNQASGKTFLLRVTTISAMTVT